MSAAAEERGRRRDGFSRLPPWVGPSTRLVHAARRADYNAGSVVAPIYQTTTYHWPADRSESADRRHAYLYSRNENPTTEVAAEVIREMEGGEAARLFASGMGAVSSVALSLLNSGDTVVALEGIYPGTTALLTDFLPRFGIRVRQVAESAATAPEEVVDRGTRLVVLETPTNPTLRVHDIGRWARAADAVGAVVVVDNTFATPINQRPLALGADLVVHAATKYLGGHADLTAGVVVGPERLLARIDPRSVLGAPADPFAAFLLARGLRTLALRMARHNENGRRVAEAVRDHPSVARVRYPGWASSEEDAIAACQMTGRGGVVSLSLRGGLPAAESFLSHLRLAHIASSFGGVESLASLPLWTSHRNQTPDERAARGLDEGFVRLSLGIEDPDDLVRDVREALDALPGATGRGPAT